MLSQPAWHDLWRGVRHLVVDEVHALVPNKRGADLAVSLERLAAQGSDRPGRVGLSATCRPADPVARFLVGPTRTCRIVEAPRPEGSPDLVLEVESLLKPDEAPHRGLTYRRLLRRLREATGSARTTVVFANTRAFTEKVTHDLRRELGVGPEAVAAHHSALDAERRRAVEASLKAGKLKAVVTSTSLELGVDIGPADLSVLVGLPGSRSRLPPARRPGGARVGVETRGLMLAATPAELAGAVVTARAAKLGRVEPLRIARNPLDVLCQQLIGMACGGEWSSDEAFALVRKAGPMAELSRSDFDACLDFLAGDLAAPVGSLRAGAGLDPEVDSPPDLETGRPLRHPEPPGDPLVLVERRHDHVGGVGPRRRSTDRRSGRSKGRMPSVSSRAIASSSTAEALEFRRLEGLTVHAKASGGRAEPAPLVERPPGTLGRAGPRPRPVPRRGRRSARRWPVLAPRLARRRARPGPRRGGRARSPLRRPGAGQRDPGRRHAPRRGIPRPRWPGLIYAFHAPLGRPACEAMGRATAARLGRRFGRDLRARRRRPRLVGLACPEGAKIDLEDLPDLLDPEGFEEDVLEGLDRGDLLARRFRHVAATALMVLRRPEGGRTRVGGLLWVSQRLYPLVKAACPDHPLLRETRREVLEDLPRRPDRARMAAKSTRRSGSGRSTVPRRSPPPGSTRAVPSRSASNPRPTPSDASTNGWSPDDRRSRRLEADSRRRGGPSGREARRDRRRPPRLRVGQGRRR